MKRILMVVLVAVLVVAAPAAQSLQTEEVLGLVAMPLAVAAVSEISGVPMDDLTHLVAAMNDSRVAPVEFVEIVRYSPVLLVDPVAGPEVVTFVTNEVDRGVSGDALVLSLRERIRASGIDTIELTDRSRVVLDRRVMIPDTVVRRVDEIRNHPHGGPPGQIKKEVGVQTGAEIVHGTKPGSDQSRPPAVNDGRGNRDDGPPNRVEKPGRENPGNSGKARDDSGQSRGNSDKARGNQSKGNSGKAKGKGNNPNRGDR